MNISFIINEPIQNASGGYKVVYIYANELVKNGDNVSIYYRCRKEVLFSNYKFPFVIKLLIANFFTIKGPKWFKLNKKVKKHIICSIDNERVKNGDVVIATASDTAKDVNYLDSKKGKKYYLIQGYENWMMSEQELFETYSFDMTKITVSNWLKEKIMPYDTNNKLYCVLNGIRNDEFYIVNPIDNRNNNCISMLYHDLESKGTKEGMEVIYKLKEKYPELKVCLFGVVDKPSNLPEWITYTHNATVKELNKIYNESSIYLCPSWNEGFGLTAAEAMMCGCALVSTQTKGIQEYATKENSCLVEIHDKENMYNYCSYLIDNPNERIKMAEKGSAEVTKKLNYKKSVDEFIKLLHEK